MYLSTTYMHIHKLHTNTCIYMQNHLDVSACILSLQNVFLQIIHTNTYKYMQYIHWKNKNLNMGFYEKCMYLHVFCMYFVCISDVFSCIWMYLYVLYVSMRLTIFREFNTYNTCKYRLNTCKYIQKFVCIFYAIHTNTHEHIRLYCMYLHVLYVYVCIWAKLLTDEFEMI